MLFQVYGENAATQWFGLAAAILALLLLNGILRRSRRLSTFFVLVVPSAVLVYTAVLIIASSVGAEWALANPTRQFMCDWFHLAEMLIIFGAAALFWMLRYRCWLGRRGWATFLPCVMLALNSIVCIVYEVQTALNAWYQWWCTPSGVWLFGGVHNVFNCIAGILSVISITGYTGIELSRNQRDVIWPDATSAYIAAYSLWSFSFAYNCLPTNAWYCGAALLLAPIAALMWSRRSWLSARFNTAAMWCAVVQIFPVFFTDSAFAVQTVQYVEGWDTFGMVNFVPMTLFSTLALGANIALSALVFRQARRLRCNPYTNELFAHLRDYPEEFPENP